MLIQLTDYDTGLEVYVDPTAIKSMRHLGAEVYSLPGDERNPTELGRRTRIDTSSDLFLVRESPQEIMEKANHA